jgi:hypothetical protein
MKKIVFIFLFINNLSFGQDGNIFLLINPPKQVKGLKITKKLTINGRLDEKDWNLPHSQIFWC